MKILLSIVIFLILVLTPKSTFADHHSNECKLSWGQSYSVWVNPNVGSAYDLIFTEGFHKWSNAFLHVHGYNPFRMANGPGDANIHVQFYSASSLFGHSYTRATCGLEPTFCYSYIGPITSPLHTWIIGHEIGHCLGWHDHVPWDWNPKAPLGGCPDYYWGVMSYCTIWNKPNLAFYMQSGYWESWKSDGDMVWCYHNGC